MARSITELREGLRFFRGPDDPDDLEAYLQRETPGLHHNLRVALTMALLDAGRDVAAAANSLINDAEVRVRRARAGVLVEEPLDRELLETRRYLRQMFGGFGYFEKYRLLQRSVDTGRLADGRALLPYTVDPLITGRQDCDADGPAAVAPAWFTHGGL